MLALHPKALRFALRTITTISDEDDDDGVGRRNRDGYSKARVAFKTNYPICFRDFRHIHEQLINAGPTSPVINIMRLERISISRYPPRLHRAYNVQQQNRAEKAQFILG